MGPTDPEKESLRRVLLGRRDAVSHEMAGIASARIQGRLESLPAFAGARTVAFYHAVGSEVPTAGMIAGARAAGRRVCLPRVDGGALDFRVAEEGRLEPGAFGVTEPRSDCPACGRPDIVVVPAVGVSPACDRLGYGRGYYDRYLASAGAPSAALAYSGQVVRSVPTGPGDVPVDWVVTEGRVYSRR